MNEQDVQQLAQAMAAAVTKAMCAAQRKWRIPFTSITIGINRVEMYGSRHVKIIDIKIWWNL